IFHLLVRGLTGGVAPFAEGITPVAASQKGSGEKTMKEWSSQRRDEITPTHGRERVEDQMHQDLIGPQFFAPSVEGPIVVFELGLDLRQVRRCEGVLTKALFQGSEGDEVRLHLPVEFFQTG